MFLFCHHFCSLNNNNVLIQRSYFKCLYLWYQSQPEVLCEFMFEKMWWLTVIEGCLCGAPSSVHYERFMASFALSVCFLFLAPGPVLILPWTFAAEGLRRTGGGWIWIAVQVCACCNLHQPPSPLGLCTILFEFKCVAEEKVPHRFPVKLYSGSLNPPRLPHRAFLNLKCNKISCVKWKHRWNKSQAVYDHRWANISHLASCHMGILSSLGG